MISKQQLQQFVADVASELGYTHVDVLRAIKVARQAGCNVPINNKEDIYPYLLHWSGKELIERQRLQAAQRGIVTKQRNFIKQLSTKLRYYTDVFVPQTQALQQKQSEIIQKNNRSTRSTHKNNHSKSHSKRRHSQRAC